jgi:hypothetical protein
MTYENDWIPVFILLTTIVLVGWAGYFFGREFEGRHWRKVVPDQMHAHCMECMDLGRELMRVGK